MLVDFRKGRTTNPAFRAQNIFYYKENLRFNKHRLIIFCLCGAFILIFLGLMLVSLSWVPAINKRKNLVQTTCIVEDLIYVPKVCAQSCEDCRTTYVDCSDNTVTWKYTLLTGETLIYMNLDRHLGLCINQTEICWYNVNDSQNVRFDTYYVEWKAAGSLICIVFGLLAPITAYTLVDGTSRIPEPMELGTYDFLMGHVDKKSTIYKNFSNNELYDPKLSTLIMSFVDKDIRINIGS